MLCGTWWAAASAMGLVATTQQWLVFWLQLQWLGITFMPVGWLLFALAYTGRNRYVSFRWATALSVVPTLTLALALTEGVHDILYAEMAITASGPFTLLSVTPGPWFWVYYIYASALLLAGTVYIVQLAVAYHERYLGQVIALLLIVLPPWLASIGNIVGVTPIESFDPTPLTFVVSGIAGIVALRRSELLDATPVTGRLAQQSLVDSMEDGVIVVDNSDRIVEANPRAKEILDTDRSLRGDPASTAVEPYSEVMAANEERPRIDLADGNTDRIYEVQVTPLDDGHRDSGKILIFHDVTDQQTRLQRLDVLNRVLRHNLRNEMNVVYGYADQIVDRGDTVDVEAVGERIKEKSMQMVDLGDRAREIDDVLRTKGKNAESVALETLLEWEQTRARKEHPEIEFESQHTGPAVECHLALETVLKIIVETVIEHNDAEHPVVTLTGTVDDESVTIAVSDNGPGIPESERAILDAGEETKLKHGSGLGLWLANWGAQALSGELRIGDSSQDGTALSIVLPRVDSLTESNREG